MNWNNYYLEQAGYGASVPYFRGSHIQRGYGLGSIFKKFFSWIVPVMRDHALPALKTGAKEVGKVAVESAANIAKDIIAGKDVKETAKEHSTKAIDQLKEKATEALEGKGIKRKRKSRKRLIHKKINLDKDIFN